MKKETAPPATLKPVDANARFNAASALGALADTFECEGSPDRFVCKIKNARREAINASGLLLITIAAGALIVLCSLDRPPDAQADKREAARANQVAGTFAEAYVMLLSQTTNGAFQPTNTLILFTNSVTGSYVSVERGGSVVFHYKF